MVDNGSWSTIKVPNQSVGCIDTQVMVNRCQEVTWTTDSLDDILTPFVSGTNEPSGLETTPGPDI